MTEADATTGRDEIRSRRLTTEEMVRNQLDRCNTIRCDTNLPNSVRIPMWSEAIETLADLVMPWAQDEDKKAIAAGGRGQFMQEWDDRSVAVVQHNGQAIVVPTAQDCRQHQQIIHRLLDRQGLLVKRRNVSGPQPRSMPAGAASTHASEEENAPQVEM